MYILTHELLYINKANDGYDILNSEGPCTRIQCLCTAGLRKNGQKIGLVGIWKTVGQKTQLNVQFATI